MAGAARAAVEREIERHRPEERALRTEADGPRRTFSEAERQAAFAELRAELDAIGAGAVGLRLTADPADEAMGRYARGVIEIALPNLARCGACYGTRSSMRCGISARFPTAIGKCSPHGLDASDIRTRYADRSEEARIEEAVAEAYRRWSENRLETDAHCGTASYVSAASGNRQDGRWRPATLRCFPALLATINSISLQTSV